MAIAKETYPLLDGQDLHTLVLARVIKRKTAHNDGKTTTHSKVKQVVLNWAKFSDFLRGEDCYSPQGGMDDWTAKPAGSSDKFEWIGSANGSLDEKSRKLAVRNFWEEAFGEPDTE